MPNHRGRAIAVLIAAAVAGGLLPTDARSAPPSCPDAPAGYPTAKLSAGQPVFAWNADFTEEDVSFRSRESCALLAGTLYRPSAATPSTNRLPGVVVIPPSGGAATRAQLAYVARHLASNGYLALTVDPQGVGQSESLGSPVPCGTEPGHSSPSPCPGVPFQRMDNWMDAAVSALDFFLSPANPAAALLDRRRIGAVGHSLGARASSYLQDPAYDPGSDGVHPRIAAVVGLDNLSSNYYADPSAASGGGVSNAAINGQPLGGDEPIAVHVPGLGLSSDEADATADPDTKKFAFSYWRDRGVPSGMLVFEGAAHGQFSQTRNSDEADLFSYATYTRAWFDRWLRGDRAAESVLLATSIDGVPVESFLSDTQRSAWFLPQRHLVIDDWRSASVPR